MPGVTSEPWLPMRTERALLRPFNAADAPALAAYRNDPETARYQDWDLPFTVDDARAMIDEQADLDGPQPDGWVQIAIDVDGRLAGDVAVGMGEQGLLAMIGYTLDPAFRGRGLATEVAGAVVDRLLAGGAHRVSATLDPANVSSARVLERLGFRYEGCAVSAAYVRGEWFDDDRYAILTAERAAWLARPMSPVVDVRLVQLSADNLDAVVRLRTFHSQRRFVAPMEHTFAQILVPGTYDGEPVRPWWRVIEADGETAGFALLVEPSARHTVPYLWRLLVDQRFQGRGVGRRAIEAIVDVLRSQGHGAVELGYRLGPGTPAGFYTRMGFAPTGEIRDDETIARLQFG
jgi:RimJ/RimL family protein N-acetyltransferase